MFFPIGVGVGGGGGDVMFAKRAFKLFFVQRRKVLFVLSKDKPWLSCVVWNSSDHWIQCSVAFFCIKGRYNTFSNLPRTWLRLPQKKVEQYFF